MGGGGGGEKKLNKWANSRHRTVQVISIRAASESQMGIESRLKSLTDSHPSLTLHQKKIKKEKDKDRPNGTVTSDNFLNFIHEVLTLTQQQNPDISVLEQSGPQMPHDSMTGATV